MANTLATVFVANLPPLIDSFGLKGIFSRAGLVKHVFIPKIQGKKFRFGFVSFEDVQGAQKSISLLNSKLVRGFPLIVEKARGPIKLRQHSRPMPKSSVNNQEGDDLLTSLKKIIAIEIDKIVRTALDSFVGKIEGLIASKSIHGVTPRFSPSHSALSPLHNSPKLSKFDTSRSPIQSYVDVLTGKRVVDPAPSSAEVVEDSLSQQIPTTFVHEEGEFQVQDKDEEDRDLKVVESEVAESEKPSAGSDLVLDSPIDKNLFSFNSKPRRSRKKLGKPSARFFRSPTRPGDKRKLRYSDNHTTQGSEKRLKCTKEVPTQGQHADSTGLEALSPNIKEVEVAEDSADTLLDNSNPNIRPPSCDVVTQTKDLLTSSTPEDSLRVRAIRTLSIGARLGVKVVKGEKNEETCIRGAMRVIQKQRRYVEQCTSEENSVGSADF